MFDQAMLKREARKKGTPATRLLELAALDVQLARTVAKSRFAPLAVLEVLAAHSDATTRKLVAQHPATSAALLDRLSQDHHMTVLKQVIVHPQLSHTALKSLAQHRQAAVRKAVCLREKLPLDLMELLLSDPHPSVRLALAQAGQLTPPLVERLYRDPSPDIRAALLLREPGLVPVLKRRKALSDPVGLVRGSAFWSLAGYGLSLPASSAELLTAEELERAAQDECEEVRLEVMALVNADRTVLHHRLPKQLFDDIRAQYLHDACTSIRREAVRFADGMQIRRMLNDPAEEVRAMAQIALDNLNQSRIDKEFNQILQNTDIHHKVLMAKDQAASPEILIQYVQELLDDLAVLPQHLGLAILLLENIQVPQSLRQELAQHVAPVMRNFVEQVLHD